MQPRRAGAANVSFSTPSTNLLSAEVSQTRPANASRRLSFLARFSMLLFHHSFSHSAWFCPVDSANKTLLSYRNSNIYTCVILQCYGHGEESTTVCNHAACAFGAPPNSESLRCFLENLEPDNWERLPSVRLNRGSVLQCLEQR